MQVRRILRGGHNQRWSRSATGVPERERTERIFAVVRTWFPRERWTQIRQLCAGTRLHPRVDGFTNCEILAQPAVGGQPL